jgi:ABC-2 type transport system permease protein
MTSKNLYSNLLREDMKRRVWTLALSMLAFVIGLPIYAMLRLERMKESIESLGLVEAQKYFASISSKDGMGILIVITIAGAFICGIHGFSYLYSKSKVDLYHSIPVKREKLFIVTYLNGIIIYLVPYLVNLVLYFIIGIANGLITKSAVSGAFSFFIINLIGYLLIYSITIIAVMMTGNIIVGLLGTAVFMLYGPAVITIKTAICETFYKTYYQAEYAPRQLANVSPIFAYNRLIGSLGEHNFLMNLIAVMVSLVIAIVVGAILYKIRPSEAAGKSMAFKSTQVVIKVLIVLPTAIVGGLVFRGMSESNSFTWMAFGIVFIGFLAHGIIEIIYNNDFKCIISNKIQLTLCIIVSLIIAGAAKADLFHYDTYLPDTGKIESMSIAFDNLEPYNEYYDLNKEYSNSYSYNYYNYISPTTYRLDHMNMTNFESVYQLVDYAKENNLKDAEEVSNNNSEVYVSFTVKYTLKNNAEKYRSYTVKLKDIMNYSDENYKDGVYQILTMDQSLIRSIEYSRTESSNETLKLTKGQQEEFINIFTNELKTLTGNDLVESIPVAQLSFIIGNNNNYIPMNYYVYPQFTQTIAYMKSVGANLDTLYNSDNIESITITDYNSVVTGDAVSTVQQMPVGKQKEYGYDGLQYKQVTITDRDQVEAISNAIVPSVLTYGTKLNSNIPSNLEALIVYKQVGNKEEVASVVVDKLPENIRQEIGY